MSIPQYVKDLPHLPGIYIFKDAKQQLLYVGKAKDLRDRVTSYFYNDDWKVKELIKEQTTVSHIVTYNDHEALLLEAQLIRDFKPPFNVLLKSGNPFLYILFTSNELKIVRTKKEQGTYFGPFLHKKDARAVFDYLTRTFKLRTCNLKIVHGCLEYHLGNCPGSCRPDFKPEDNLTNLELAKQALRGNYKEFLHIIETRIQEHNRNKEFEKSRHLAEYAKNFEAIFKTLKTKFSEQKYAAEIMDVTSPLKRSHETLMTGLTELKDMIEFEGDIKTIDCFDISHFQSTHIVGSCIRFTDTKPEKDKFRRFKIKSLTQQHDYAALQEIVRRRYRDGDIPDVIMIDGGKGQRNAIKAVLPDATIISLAKREERVFSDNHPEGFVLDMQSSMGQLLISLRDYAHHFAISYHKLLRKKAVRETE